MKASQGTWPRFPQRTAKPRLPLAPPQCRRPEHHQRGHAPSKQNSTTCLQTAATAAAQTTAAAEHTRAFPAFLLACSPLACFLLLSKIGVSHLSIFPTLGGATNTVFLPSLTRLHIHTRVSSLPSSLAPSLSPPPFFLLSLLPSLSSLAPSLSFPHPFFFFF